jgi:alpha-glucosidase
VADAVVYEVYVRSFADSDGDGVGDLEGIRSRLPHLVDLGVDASG